ncbi:unnamed protein product [Caenorhabditis bovis]|uniref:Uncharacterized protein n=1 Tax=Caenorhabditis bovis TaxID=2654633 RepID=A0A8S1ENK0_9PELO|nr:unnamed protein product [Caenorhabditis bovis]
MTDMDKQGSSKNACRTQKRNSARRAQKIDKKTANQLEDHECSLPLEREDTQNLVMKEKSQKKNEKRRRRRQKAKRAAQEAKIQEQHADQGSSQKKRRRRQKTRRGRRANRRQDSKVLPTVSESVQNKEGTVNQPSPTFAVSVLGQFFVLRNRPPYFVQLRGEAPLTNILQAGNSQQLYDLLSRSVKLAEPEQRRNSAIDKNVMTEDDIVRLLKTESGDAPWAKIKSNASCNCRGPSDPPPLYARKGKRLL